MKKNITADVIDDQFKKLQDETEASGYHLNPETEFTRELVLGLIENTERYGYPSCPCRLASGNRDFDLDIICPCDYRDPDLDEFGACYCALYVSRDITDGKKRVEPIPERRPPAEKRTEKHAVSSGILSGNLKLPVWRCRVCGYLCAREGPPESCPICKAKKDRFEKFLE
jgi:ferredoxin-thioredoxin reductase catalytic chain